MIEGPTTLVKAMKDYFDNPPITIAEMKALTDKDKDDLRVEMRKIGYDIA